MRQAPVANLFKTFTFSQEHYRDTRKLQKSNGQIGT